ncbi:SigE family RNA polymerase sigma factor [Solicola gregarius]|uniref:RNA polymerase sigma factor 70 region 4 type 2 domain-containing protein n=1 Tax=Solicola gregarius TaxID=2908642 RepID=A0AA46YKE5_9ACTN|nr:hypothetical protein [Solicola gregarius]UYM03898.1 hypothetical protein L0C25_15265 [Solicola gregarius]
MTRVEEFDSFYDSTRQYVLHQVYALSGDLGIATTSVKDAYSRAWQGWSKVRSRDPLAFVRSEAWRQSVLHRRPHLRRRKHSDGQDQELLDALHELPANARRLLVLQTIGELGPDDAAREVGVTEESVASATDTAGAALERRLGTDRPSIEARLRDLRAVTDGVPFERPSLARRRAQRRGRRRTVGVIAAGVLAVVGAGVVVTQGGPLDNAADAAGPHARQLADPDELPMADDDMLDDSQLRDIDGKPWKATDTSSGMRQRDNLSTCTPQRFADPRAAGGWVRTFAPDDDSGQYAVQSLEVSRDEKSAEAGYRRTVSWYADCSVPRLQLMRSYTLRHDGRETVMMQMRRWDDPTRTYTIGVTHSELVTTTLVHSAKGNRGANVDKFSRAVDESLAPLCDDDDRGCAKPGKVRPSLPPATSTAPEFLGVVDLPPVKNVDKMWVGTDPEGANPNPSATACDKAEFKGKTIDSAQARTFVIPEEPALSDAQSPFGISQTVGDFKNQKAAVAFMRDAIGRIGKCEEDDLTAKVHDGKRIASKGITGNTWRLTFEVDDKHTVDYRLGLVRAGGRVAQVTFAPLDKYDMRPADFDRLVARAGARLRTPAE